MTCEAMLSKAPVPPGNVHPVPADGTPEEAASRHERTLQAARGAAVLIRPGRCSTSPRSAGPGRPYGVVAAGRTGAGGAQALGRRGPHGRPEIRITRLSGDREQPAGFW